MADFAGYISGFQIYYDTIDPPPDVVVPPMQRASYVFFSQDITEKQIETRLTRSFLQLLVTDPPVETPPPSALGFVNIVGNLYDPKGVQITFGRLAIKPRGPIGLGDHFISPQTTYYDITGTIDLNLAPSNGVLYDIEYIPYPSDGTTPANLQTGYFRAVWDVPNSGPVDIADL